MNYHTLVHAMCCLTLISLAFLSACNSKESPTVVGPVPLRDAAHMKEYIGSSEWRLVGSDANRWFRFSTDGKFSAGGDGLADLLGFATTVTEVTGLWDADKTSLYLSEIGGGAEDAMLTKSLPLGWLDGKLNINIAGEQYRR